MLKRIWSRIAQWIHLPAGSRRVDYKSLSQYIVRINELEGIGPILREASRCLKDILDYRLFALAVQDDDLLEVWIDPRLFSKSIHNLIARDFGAGQQTRFNHIQDGQTACEALTFQTNELCAYALMGDRYDARLYLLPRRRLQTHHGEIIQIVVQSLAGAIKKCIAIKRLEKDAAIDPLTGCYNRRELERLMDHQISSSQRHGKDLSLIMLDLDHFKAVNDTHGHQAGDQVLIAVAAALHAAIRKGDYICRYGGEEFVIVLPETKMIKALDLAERLRRTIANLPVAIAKDTTIGITASFGVAALTPRCTWNDLIDQADAMLYQAKTCSRNRVMPERRLMAAG